MDDPYSIWALLGYPTIIVLGWFFVRAERSVAMYTQAGLERLLEQARPWGARFLQHTAGKRRITLALGIGQLVARIALIALVFLEAYRWSSLGFVPYGLAYPVAGLLVLLPLVAVQFVLPGLGSGDETSAAKLRVAAPVILGWTVLCWPVLWPLDRLLIYLSLQPEGREAREEALMAHLETDSEDGIIEADKRDMISSIINIDEITVREVMVPRVDVVAIERTKSLNELLKLFVETQHSRIPVYDERLDTIVGIVHAKDALRAIVSGAPLDRESTTAQALVRESSVLFVPVTKKLDDLLRELRWEKRHMAIVVDEYGGTVGLVTMEDILEEIVGEIQDEYDEEEETLYRWVSERQVEVDAGMNIADVNELLNSNLPDENGYDTLGGFLYHRFSAIPEPGAQTEHGPFKFVVKGVDNQRITKVLVEVKEEDGKAEAGPEQ